MTQLQPPVKQSVEEYATRFRSIGKAPLSLFSEAERKVLGSTPLAHLIPWLVLHRNLAFSRISIDHRGAI